MKAMQMWKCGIKIATLQQVDTRRTIDRSTSQESMELNHRRPGNNLYMKPRRTQTNTQIAPAAGTPTLAAFCADSVATGALLVSVSR